MYVLKEYDEEGFVKCSWHHYLSAALELKKSIEKHQEYLRVKIFMLECDYEGKVYETEVENETL